VRLIAIELSAARAPDDGNPQKWLGREEGWKLPEDEAIRAIENYTSSFYTLVNGREADIIVATHNGRKYLKTTADGYRPANLLSLPECP
jgi:hypothetical protein